jgi:hypothetical protein
VKVVLKTAVLAFMLLTVSILVVIEDKLVLMKIDDVNRMRLIRFVVVEAREASSVGVLTNEEKRAELKLPLER